MDKTILPRSSSYPGYTRLTASKKEFYENKRDSVELLLGQTKSLSAKSRYKSCDQCQEKECHYQEKKNKN